MHREGPVRCPRCPCGTRAEPGRQPCTPSAIRGTRAALSAARRPFAAAPSGATGARLPLSTTVDLASIWVSACLDFLIWLRPVACVGEHPPYVNNLLSVDVLGPWTSKSLGLFSDRDNVGTIVLVLYVAHRSE